MQKREVFFFLDSLGGGGAERVASELCNAFAERPEWDIGVVMLRKVPLTYQLSNRVRLYYAEDLPVTSRYGKLVRAAFSGYKKLRQGIWKPLATRLGFYRKLPHIDETGFYFYATFAMPYREFLKQHPGCTAFGFLIRSNISLLMAARGTDVRTVFCERNAPVRPDIPKNIIRLRDRFAPRCRAAVFQTEEERDYYRKLHCPTTVIPNPLKEDLPAPYQGERRHEIVNFCRLSPQKNLPLLLRAFARFHAEFPDYTLSLYGNGPEEENVRKLAQELGLADRVSVIPFAADVHARISDAAMFVSTSDFEGLSNSMLEAMAIGLPCVCTDCDGGGARMMIRDHENGLLVPKGDEDAVYHAMKEIAENPELAQTLSENAARLREELSVQKIAERWLRIV